MITSSKNCATCGNVIIKKQNCSKKNWITTNFCSRKCMYISRKGILPSQLEKRAKEMKGKVGNKCHNWKGGIIKIANRYPLFSIYLLNDKEQILYKPMFYKNYCREHRIIVALSLDRPLTNKEQVHHINGNKQDNRPENLYLFSSNSEHVAYEGLKNKYILKSNII